MGPDATTPAGASPRPPRPGASSSPSTRTHDPR